MHALEFIESLKRPHPEVPPVVLIGPGKAAFGHEPYDPLLAERTTQAIVDAFVDPSMRDLCLTVFYADECTPGEIANEAQTLPFLVERRVIVVRNAERFYMISGDKGKPLHVLLQYLQSPNPSTLLVLVSAKLDKRVKFHKACVKAGTHVECPQLIENQLNSWVQQEASARGKRINRQAISLLLERSGGYLGDVINAVNLVASYVGDNPDITDQDVITACSDVAEETVWDMTDAIAESKTAAALQALYQLLEFGKSPDEIMGTINWLLESAYKACPDTGVQNKSNFVTKKVEPLAEKWGRKKLIDALKLSTDTHFMIRSTGVDAQLALELLVIKLAAPKANRPTAPRRGEPAHT